MLISKLSRIIPQSKVTAFSYISKKKLDQIQRDHGTTKFQKIKMYGNQARYIIKQGLSGLKGDLKILHQLYSKQKTNALTQQEKKQQRKIREEFRRFIPITLINILPMSFPLLLFYILTYPTKVPTYFCLDQLYQQYQLQSIECQKKAIEFYKQNPLDTKDFQIENLSFEEIKQLSKLLFGNYEDGVVGINKYFKENPKQYFLHQRVSKHIAIKKIKNQLKKQAEQNESIQNFTLNQRIIWKYNRIMNGQDFLVFKPVQHNSNISIQTSSQNTVNKEPEVQAKNDLDSHRRHNPHQMDIPRTQPTERHSHKSPTRKNP